MTRCERDGRAAMFAPVFRETPTGIAEHALCFVCYWALLLLARPAELHLARRKPSGGVHTPARRRPPTKVPPSSSSLDLFGGAP